MPESCHDTRSDILKTLLNGETLNMLVNAVNIRLEAPSGSTPKKPVQRYNT